MRASRASALCILLAAAGAVAFRLPSLDERPMHGDEANQAVKTGILLETGEYEYDPRDHHGPTLYYLALIPAWLSGEDTLADLTEQTLRIVPMAFGVALIFVLWLLRNAVGHLESVIAALLIAVAPAFVFYSGYYIQEMLLVLFTAAFIASVWRFLRCPGFAWVVSAGVSAALMHATKETAALAFAAMIVAAVATYLFENRRYAKWAIDRAQGKYLAAAAVAAVVTWFLLYSSFFTNWRGLADSVLTYLNYLERSGGAGLHDKPWYYYLSLLAYTHRSPGPIWSDAAILALALIGAVVSFRGRLRDSQSATFLRFLAAYTIVLTLIYSVIPYKTPWSLLSFYFGWIVLAGVGAGWLLTRPKRVLVRGTAGAAVAIVVAVSALMAYNAAYAYPADPRNPYVYAHTSSAHLRLVEQIRSIAAANPEEELTIYVIQPDRDYWPLPWYLRQFKRVGYFEAIPDPPDADMLIVEPRLYPELEPQLEAEYMGIIGGLRPSVLRTVLVRRPLWDAFVDTRR